jgi:hypothetical protein
VGSVKIEQQKSHRPLAEPFGQRAFGIYATLSSIHVEQPHNIDSALPKKPTALLQN